MAAKYASSNIVGNLGINPYGSKYAEPVGLDGKIVAGAVPLWNDNWSDAYTQDANRTEAQVNISGGNGKVEVWNGTSWVEANGYITSFKVHTS